MGRAVVNLDKRNQFLGFWRPVEVLEIRHFDTKNLYFLRLKKQMWNEFLRPFYSILIPNNPYAKNIFLWGTKNNYIKKLFQVGFVCRITYRGKHDSGG